MWREIGVALAAVVMFWNVENFFDPFDEFPKRVERRDFAPLFALLTRPIVHERVAIFFLRRFRGAEIRRARRRQKRE